MEYTRRMLIKRLLVLLSLAVLLCFLLVILFDQTLGWFSTQTTVAGSGMQIAISNEDSSLISIRCFPVDEINGNAYSFLEPPADYVPELPCEDPANIVESLYKKAIVIRLTYRVAPNTAAHITVQGGDWIDRDHTPTTEGVGTNNLSNCIQMTAGTVSGNTFTKTGTPLSFITQDPTSATIYKPETVNFQGNLAGTTEFWLVIEYNRTLIEYFCQTSSSGAEKINYVGDLIFRLTVEGGT